MFIRWALAIFVVLHGLVHLWYLTLSQGLVEFEAEMGWTGSSWLLSGFLGDVALRWLATTLYAVATLGFVAGGLGLAAQQEWWEPFTIAAAAISAVTIVLFWDGSTQMLVQKGLIGLVIDVIILAILLLR
jgi:membrane-associated HD superfamily phosphohydrolase